MEKNEMLKQMKHLKAVAVAVKTFTHKQFNHFLREDEDLWAELPVPAQVVLQNYYTKLIDLNQSTEMVCVFLKGMIRQINKDDDNVDDNDDDNDEETFKD